jgi:HlyD family secretion protein
MVGRSSVLAWALPVIAAGALLGAGVSIAGKSSSMPRVEPRLESASPMVTRVTNARAAPVALIGAVGLVEPSSQEIKVGTSVSGMAVQVFVAPGTKVKRGDRLFALDERKAQGVLLFRHGEVATAQARLALARSRNAALRAEVQAARTAVEAADAERDEAMDLVRMADGLNAGSTITSREVMRRQNLLRQTEAKLEESRARLAIKLANFALFDEAGGGGASIAVDLAVVQQAQHAMKLAETELELLTVRAPDDGTVLQVNLRPGEFAQAGVLSQGLVVLGRTDPMHLRVDIDEADIARYQPGAAAVASERGMARRQIKLNFVRVEPLVVPKRALSGQVTERVDTRVMQVIYAIEPDRATVLIGQQFDVFIEADKLKAMEVNVASSAAGAGQTVSSRD